MSRSGKVSVVKQLQKVIKNDNNNAETTGARLGTNGLMLYNTALRLLHQCLNLVN